MRYTGKILDGENGMDLYYYGARYHAPDIGAFTQIDPQALRTPGWSPYVCTLDNPLKYTDPDGRQAIPSTPYAVGWWNQQTELGLARFRSWQKNVAAPWVHRSVTRPNQVVKKAYLSIGSAGYAAKNPLASGIGFGGAGVASTISMIGLAVEAWLSADKQKAEALTWEITKEVTVGGIDYVLKSSPAGQIAWFVVDEFGNLIRQLNSDEIEEIGLLDSKDNGSKLADDVPSKQKDEDDGN